MFAALDVLPAIGIAYVLRGGIFSAWALFLAAMGQTSPAHLRTRAFAIVEILGGSAMSFGPVIASQLYGADPRWPFIVSSLATFAMAGVLVTSHRRSARAPRLEAVETAPGPVESL